MAGKCSYCYLPRSSCICEAAEAIACSTKISVLQHPDEAAHPKNTLRLARLCLPNMQVYVGEQASDFNQLREHITGESQRPILLYPHPKSLALESSVVISTSPSHLIFIDATWRKAYKIWCLNTWLQALPCYHFEKAPSSAYILRKTRHAEGLSSLEAVAYGLQLTSHANVAPLYAIQALWVERRRQLMPTQVQGRYEF